MTPVLDNPIELLLVHPSSKSMDHSVRGTKHLGYALECEDCTWSIKYRDGVKVDISGKLSANMYRFNVPAPPGEPPQLDSLKIDSFEFIGNSHVEWICRNALITETIDRLLSPPPNEQANSVSFNEQIPLTAASLPNPVPSPSLPPKGTTKGRRQSASAARKRSLALAEEERLKAEALQAQQQAGAAAEKHPVFKTIKWESNRIPASPVGTFGIPEKSMRCLEVSNLG